MTKTTTTVEQGIPYKIRFNCIFAEQFSESRFPVAEFQTENLFNSSDSFQIFKIFSH